MVHIVECSCQIERDKHCSVSQIFSWEAGSKSFSSVLAAGNIRLIGRQFLPMLLSILGFTIGMIIDLCHISGICPVEIDRWKMLVR